jgi:hypothetical protein
MFFVCSFCGIVWINESHQMFVILGQSIFCGISSHVCVLSSLKCLGTVVCRSQWPCGLRRRSAAAGLMRMLVRIPPEEWMSACFECCVLSGRGLRDELITCPEESYRMWCVVECDLETSRVRRPWPTGGGGGLSRQNKNEKKNYSIIMVNDYQC